MAAVRSLFRACNIKGLPVQKCNIRSISLTSRFFTGKALSKYDAHRVTRKFFCHSMSFQCIVKF